MSFNLWQSTQWQQFQEARGLKTFRLEHKSASALLIRHHLPFKNSYLYCPRGPIWKDEHDAEILLEKMRQLAKVQSAVFIRLDPEKPVPFPLIANPSSSPQPRTTLLLNLTQKESDLLNQMKPKGRYNIKVAQKNDVIAKIINKSDHALLNVSVNAFYDLLQKTSNRARFGVHEKTHYQRMLQHLPSSELILATQSNIPIAAGIFCFFGKTAIYYYGASDHTQRHLMAPYLVQWTAMQEAKRRNCETYDFLGIASSNDPKDPWQGITEFKRKFGGQEVNYPQAIDIVRKTIWYNAYRMAKYFGGS